MADFTKTDFEFIFWPIAVPWCHLDCKLLISCQIFAHRLQKEIFCTTFALIGMSDKKAETQTRSPEIQDIASSFHWLWHLGARFLISLDVTDTWGSHVPQIVCESTMECAVSDHSSDMYWVVTPHWHLLLTAAWEVGMLIKASWRKQGLGKVTACLWGYRSASDRARGLTVQCGSRACPLDQRGLLWLRPGHPGGSHRSSSGWPQLILLLIPKGCSALRAATFLPRPT